MQLILLLSAFVAATHAIVCPPNACDGVQQEALNCVGNTLIGTGFCGCTDSCAKVEGESCRPSSSLLLLGVPNTEECDDGLVCKTINLEGHVKSVCVKESDANKIFISKKRSSNFIVCPPNVCDKVVQPLLNCKGGVIKNTGFCGCYDVCAKTQGEQCASVGSVETNLIGDPSTDQCDRGLECVTVNLEGHVSSRCVPSNDSNEILMSKRTVPKCDTACRRKSKECTVSFVIYPGQWFARCNLDGNFLPEQCDNQNDCFCVDEYSGHIDEDTRVTGHTSVMDSGHCE